MLPTELKHNSPTVKMKSPRHCQSNLEKWKINKKLLKFEEKDKLTCLRPVQLLK